MAVIGDETLGLMCTTVQDAFERATVLHKEKQLAEAESLYARTLSLDPDHGGALCHLGLLRLQEGKVDESAVLLRRAVAQDPNSAEAHNYLGAALQRLGAVSEAETLYARALSLNPEHAGALGCLGMLRLQEGKVDEGIVLLRRAVAQDPNSAEAHNGLGAGLQCLGAYDEALACHDKALALAPGYSDAVLHRGRALQALDRGVEAIGCYEAVLTEAPSDARTQLLLASALEASGRDEEAFVRYRNAASLDPKLAEYLSKALAKYGQHHQVSAQAGMQRINLYIRSFLTNQGNARMGIYPDLSSAAFHDTARLPGALALEQNYEAIRLEIEGLAATEFQEGREGAFVFYENGRKNDDNCARCPLIARLIESHNAVRTQAGLLYVSKLSPGTHLKAHRGPTNVRLRCHLGIRIPDGDSGLKVAGETRRWEEGRCIVFDDSLEHEVWNHTQEPRVVLIIDFWHPHLTPTEIAYLEGLHRFAAFQAVSLNRYWSSAGGHALQRSVLELLSYFTPRKVIGYTKTRVGRARDGGYIMVDDFEGVTAAISAGIADEVSWDEDIAGRGIEVYQFDHSVDGPPIGNDRFHFFKRRIASATTAESENINSCLARIPISHKRLILKIDIEGAEWEIFDGATYDDLQRLSQIVVEFHGFSKVANGNWRQRAARTMAKLRSMFEVVHVHGNNFAPLHVVANVPLPDVVEVTFANRSMYQFGENEEVFPTSFDRPNNEHRADIFLGFMRFK